YKSSFEKYYESYEDVMKYESTLSRFGLISRGLAFIEVEVLLDLIGSSYQAMHRPGMKDELNGLQQQPPPALLLKIVAQGLIEISLNSFPEAARRKKNNDVPH
ncbi:DUF1206 domain-containing protein, partial [Pseudomonas syringae pv. tagetis]